jgi:serine/threonine protein kinase/WD40 repeat protein
MTALRDATRLTGRVLGEFTVGDKLGEGGHGVVYRAEQRTLGREAVVKILRARHGTSEVRVQRFLREAQLASRLDHPFAAHIYAFGAEPDGVLWIAMELVRGTTLRKVLDAQPGGHLPLARLVPLLDGLCEVVHTAHEQGIVHRDLKPENVMVLSRAGRLLPKLLDLGIAKLVTAAADATAAECALADEPPVDPHGPTGPAGRSTAGPVHTTQLGALIGSPHYMAPEQWVAGEPVDARTDQYALGVVTFEMIAGALPFPGTTLAELARAHLHAALPALPADVPAALTAVLARALAKRPADRFPSVLAFAEAVRAAAGLRLAADLLPRLDDDLRAEIAWLPQPIADAIAVLEAARNPHQARDALWEIVRVIARWLGILALCARSRTRAPGDDPAPVTAALRTLHRRDLRDEEWLELVRALVRPFAELRSAHPVPELVDFALAEPSPFQALFALHATEELTASEESLRDRLARTLPVLAPLLRAVAFLGAYQLIVPCGGDRAEVWMGVRRGARPVIAIAPGLPEGEPVVADLDGRAVLQLAPLVQIAAPAPGAPDEVFVFAGAGRVREHGARLVAEPHGFERHDGPLWAWFRAQLLAIDLAEPTAAEQAPYRGLAAFTEADAGTFFGRERAVDAFVNQLRAQPLLAVVGPSGTGKSSFVRAGVIPALPAGWRAIVVRPGAAPLAALAARVEPRAGEVRVIVIDQLEELFTLCADPGERERFARELARLARAAEPTRVILALRDDFLGRLAELAPLRDLLARAVTLLATPADDDLLRVLIEPAQRAGYDFDPGLAARMVAAVAGRPGALALLSFTALRLWELRDRHFRRLSREAYEAIGGVEGALAAHAEDTLRACTGDEQRLVREAFRHLVTAEGTRAVLTRRELDDVLGAAPQARAVRDRLVEARLLVISEGHDGEDRIEVIHEALLVAWPRLVEWRRADAEGARLRDQLHAAARQWHDRDRARGLLWRDDALDDYVRWRARWPGELPALDQAFGDASVRDAARGRRLRRVLAGAAAVVLAASVIALALLNRASQRSAELAHTALIDALIQQGQRELFAGDYLRALPYLAAAYRGGDDSSAVRTMLHRAIKLADQPQVRLRGQIRDAVFRAADREVLAVGFDGDAVVADAETGRVRARLPPPPGPPGLLRGGAVSADGAVAAVAGDDAILVWDGAAVRTLAIGHPLERGTLLAFDAGHAQLAVAADHAVEVRDLATGALRWSQPVPGAVRQLIVVGDEVVVVTARNLASALDRTAWLVSATRVQELGPAYDVAAAGPARFVVLDPTRASLRDATGAILWSYEATNIVACAISAGGDRVAFGLASGAIVLADAATGQRAGLLIGHTGQVSAMTFAPDGQRLLSMAFDRELRIWDLRRAREQFHYVGFEGSPSTIRVSADGRRIAATSSETLQLSPIDDPSAMLVLQAGEQVYGSSFVAHGTQLLTTTESGVELWDAVTGARLEAIASTVSDGVQATADRRWLAIPIGDRPDVEIRAAQGGALHATLHASSLVMWAGFDHAGRRVVTGNTGGLLELWTLEGEKLATIRAHASTLEAVAFSPDDRRLLSASNDCTARLWDVASGRELVQVRHNDQIDGARFDATGGQFATASEDQYVMIWDAATGLPVHAYPHEAAVRNVALDDTRVAGATLSGVVQLWDRASGRETGRFRHAASAQAVDFDGDRLLTTGFDGRIVVWDVASAVATPAQVVAWVCRLAKQRDMATRELLGCPGLDPAVSH